MPKIVMVFHDYMFLLLRINETEKDKHLGKI
jgi:hypothetical protein